MKNVENQAVENGGIDAVEMVRRIRNEHHAILKNKSPEERREFYRKKAQELHEKLGIREEKRSA